MLIETKLINLNTDYNLITQWWVDRKQTVIPLDYLSEFGVMCLIDKKPISAMWLYPILTCKWSMIRFPISNKDTSKKERNIAMNYVLDNLINISRDMGYNKIFCTTNHPGLIEKLNKIGMVMDSENCKHFWGAI